jgi:uroporphyrinogen decarboxylase
MMRQAGRYLPEFRETRKTASFFQLCRNPELACEVTLQPLRRYPLDAAIIFSDILVVPQALGLEVEMEVGVGPIIPQPLQTPSDISRLIENLDVSQSLGYVFDAIRLTRKRLEESHNSTPLIGFAGAPWTLFAYMVEGSSSKTWSKAKRWFYMYPEGSHQVLQRLTDVIVEFLVGQVRAGAQALQVFDSWAGELGPDVYRTFVFPYMKQIAERVKRELGDLSHVVPLIAFPKGAFFALSWFVNESEFDVLSLDWTIDPVELRHQLGENSRRVTLQGNLDPTVLYAPPNVIRTEVQKMIQKFGTQNYIANLGHGLMPDHDPEHVGAFVHAIQEISKELNNSSSRS